jgi:hypothetical protein
MTRKQALALPAQTQRFASALTYALNLGSVQFDVNEADFAIRSSQAALQQL